MTAALTTRRIMYPDLREISLERNDVVPLISSIKELRAEVSSICVFLLLYYMFECSVAGRRREEVVTKRTEGYFTILKAVF
jgi:hypothetical protein